MSSDPLQELAGDHARILEKARALEASLSNASFEWLEEVWRAFESEAENHHRKEELLLFPPLSRFFQRRIEALGGGIRPHGGPVTVMLAEHKSMRYIMTDCAQALAERDREKLSARMKHLMELLRSHIFKEENMLYSVAKLHLTSSEKEEIAQRMRTLLDTSGGRGRAHTS